MSEREMKEKYFRVIKVLKGLGSPIRFQICRLLISKDELKVVELTQNIGCDQSQTSNHLGKLRDLDLVRYRHEGRNVVYRLKKPELVEKIIDLAKELSRDE